VAYWSSPQKNRIRLLPPLNIPFDLLKKAVGVIKSACAE